LLISLSFELYGGGGLVSRLLIVDRYGSIRDLLARIMKKKGYESLKAKNSDIALRLIDKIPFDTMITDVEMVEMDGFEFIELMKSKKHDLRVIVVTSLDDDESREKARKLGVTQYLTKPLHIDQLLAAIGN
jgi:DNA-binding response OmpR family regulator